MTDELKPCPFCGMASHGLIPMQDKGCFFIRCGGCATEGPWGKSPATAIEAWNTRAEAQGEGNHENDS